MTQYLQPVGNLPPFPVPHNRYEARSNAVHYARLMADSIQAGAPIQPGTAYATMAQTWAAVAQAFPEEDIQDTTFQGLMDRQEPAGGPSKGYQTVVALPAFMVGHGDTVEVPSNVWDTLRYVAMQHLAQTPHGQAMVDREESTNSGNWEIVVEEVGTRAPIRVSLRSR